MADSSSLRDDSSRPTVVIYTHSLLEPSMTFILSHAKALKRYQPVFAGAHRVTGLPMPGEQIFTANRGGLHGQVEEFAFRRFGVAGRLGKNLRRFQPRLVHAHFGQSGPAALTLAKAVDAPLIVTYHGQDATTTDDDLRHSWRGREYLRGRSQVKNEASLIIAVSDFIRSKLLAGGYPSEKIVTHRNGIDLSYFSVSDTPRVPVALFVGRFVEKKGCEYFLRALGHLRATGSIVQGVLVGDGPLRPELERISKEVDAAAKFVGFLPLDEVRSWLGRVSVVVVPSVTAANGDSEGLPTVIIEAQASGTPVVVTRHAGNAEGVEDGVSAIVVQERDVPALADAIHYFIGNPGAVARYGAAGRALVERSFELNEQVAGLERLYDAVVTGCVGAKSRLEA